MHKYFYSSLFVLPLYIFTQIDYTIYINKREGAVRMKSYIETLTFQDESNKLREKGIPESSIKKYTECMSQFDENGCELDTDYTNVVIAYPHPIP